jgi:hypothetical protein
LLCSRHNPSLLQRNGTGSHLYTPNLHTLGLQGTHSVERTYIALVGFGFNRCLSLPYIYIIPHFCGFVKRFLKIFQKTFSRLIAYTYCASLIARPLTLILYHKNTHLSIWQIAQTFARGRGTICAKRRRHPGGRAPSLC